MKRIKYWIWAIVNADKEINWCWSEWRLFYDYFWYDGPHRSVGIGPFIFYINA